MPKAVKVNDGKIMIYCEGCKENHYADERWTFNNDFENPTFSPSLLVEIGHYPKPSDICHSFVKDGNIQYLNDCTHHLAGQTVELLDEERWYEEETAGNFEPQFNSNTDSKHDIATGAGVMRRALEGSE